MLGIKSKLSIIGFLEYAVWGSYLTSMGIFFANRGLGGNVGFLFAIQGFVALVIPILTGYVADKWLSTLKVYRICHIISMIGLASIGCYALSGGVSLTVYAVMFFVLSAGFIPTISLYFSLSYQELSANGYDTVAHFPAIRMWGTVGFVFSMWIVNWLKGQQSGMLFVQGAFISALLLLASCMIKEHKGEHRQHSSQSLTLAPLKERNLAVLLLFAFFIGLSLQLSNAYNGPFLDSFAADPAMRNVFFVRNSVLLLSVSQIAEALVMLLVPVFMKNFSIKCVYAIGIISWILHFILLAFATPCMPSALLIILSMLIYGVSFNLYSIATSLYIDMNVPANIRSSAQGFVLMFSNGLGGTVGIVACQFVVNKFTESKVVDGVSYLVGNWTSIWLIFSAYMFVLLFLFLILYRNKK